MAPDSSLGHAARCHYRPPGVARRGIYAGSIGTGPTGKGQVLCPGADQVSRKAAMGWCYAFTHHKYAAPLIVSTAGTVNLWLAATAS